MIITTSFLSLGNPSVSVAAVLDDFDSTPVKTTNEFEYAQQYNDAAEVLSSSYFVYSL